VTEELRKKTGYVTVTAFPFGFTKTRQNTLLMVVLQPRCEFQPKKQDVKRATRTAGL